MEKLAKRLLGDMHYGSANQRIFPTMGRAWGGPLNGQAWRCRLVSEIILKTDPSIIFETGTYRGTTTEWLAAFQLPIYSCEASAENFGFSSSRLKCFPNVHLVHDDSRTALRSFLDEPAAPPNGTRILFYLDAHWNADLPLLEELNIIFSSTVQPIVLVDDFEVPGDSGYGFDDYGPGKSLTLTDISQALQRNNLIILHPSTPSHRETGAKRGCALIARKVDRPLLRDVTLLIQ